MGTLGKRARVLEQIRSSARTFVRPAMARESRGARLPSAWDLSLSPTQGLTATPRRRQRHERQHASQRRRELHADNDSSPQDPQKTESIGPITLDKYPDEMKQNPRPLRRLAKRIRIPQECDEALARQRATAPKPNRHL